MTAKDIVAELKKLGNAQTKKTWMNHGAQETCLGGGCKNNRVSGQS